MNDQWYFAYGSNLARNQKEERTGRIKEERRAQLHGYRIAFNKLGKDGTGKANIVPEKCGTVWGIVYRCTPKALNKMDLHEGVQGGQYFRKTIRVQVEGGDELEAVTYIAVEDAIYNSLLPTPKYLQTILQGAIDHELPEEYIRGLDALGNQRNTSRHDSPTQNL